MEEKNFDLKSFTGFILIGAILLYMMYQNQPSPNDTSLNDQTNQEEVVNEISKIDPTQSSFNLNESVKKTDGLNHFNQKKNVLSNTALENEVLAIEISNLGGMLNKVRLKNFVDYDSVPVSLIKNGNSLFNLNFSTTDGKNINTSDLYFEPTLKVNGEKQVVSMKFMVSEDQFIEYLYSLGKDDYMKAVGLVKNYIEEGDVMQVVLAQDFSQDFQNNPFDLYRALRQLNPSPYMYYLDLDECQIVGASPEILIRLEDDKVTLRPIAGTRKRGQTKQEDRKL